MEGNIDAAMEDATKRLEYLDILKRVEGKLEGIGAKVDTVLDFPTRRSRLDDMVAQLEARSVLRGAELEKGRQRARLKDAIFRLARTVYREDKGEEAAQDGEVD